MFVRLTLRARKMLRHSQYHFCWSFWDAFITFRSHTWIQANSGGLWFANVSTACCAINIKLQPSQRHLTSSPACSSYIIGYLDLIVFLPSGNQAFRAITLHLIWFLFYCERILSVRQSDCQTVRLYMNLERHYYTLYIINTTRLHTHFTSHTTLHDY